MTDLYHTTIRGHGRVVIPAGLRSALGWERGDDVVVRVENDTVVIANVRDAVRQFQAAVRRHVPAGVGLADDLVADRRRAAADE